MNTTTEGFWTTHREIEFLETLSSNLQRKYLATMHKRHNWGSIDPIEVETYLRVKLLARHQRIKWGPNIMEVKGC